MNPASFCRRQEESPMTLRFGIILANRGVLLGMCAPRDLLRMADAAEACPLLDSVWAGEPFDGRFYQFSGVTLEPKPVQSPCPIWLTTNAQRLASGVGGVGGSELALSRVGWFADGWMTHSLLPADRVAHKHHGRWLGAIPPDHRGGVAVRERR
jgi:hypothetical protein